MRANPLPGGGFAELPFTVPQVVAQYLSYQDAPLDAAAKKRALEYDHPAAEKYGAALIALFDRYGDTRVEMAAHAMRAEFDQEFGKLGLDPQPYSLSTTWAMWDMAKQYHFATHPAEIQAHYDPQDPMTSAQTRREIVNRHLGWEVYGNFQGGALTEESFQFHPPHVRERILELVAEPANASHTLSSWKLAELGELVRQALAVSALGGARIV